ncbi:MAG TPA: sec-independent translocase [Kribbellaceae bacterium]|nr:sec-independent translocase [Kribbellaceae bacterium]
MLDIGFPELVVIALVVVLVFGPHRLPEFARSAGRFLRTLRQMVNSAQDDLRRELGPEFQNLDVTDLNPRNFVKKHLLDGIDDDLASDPVKPVDTVQPKPALAAGEKPPYDPEST